MDNKKRRGLLVKTDRKREPKKEADLSISNFSLLIDKKAISTLEKKAESKRKIKAMLIGAMILINI